MKTKSKSVTSIKEAIANVLAQLKRHRQILAFVKKHAAFLDTLDCRVSPCCDYLDFDYPSHSTSVKIMTYFKAGKWEKTYETSTVTYKGKVDGMNLRMYCGALPPNCKVVTETVVVPEHVVPEHTETKTKIVCNEDIVESTTETASA